MGSDLLAMLTPFPHIPCHVHAEFQSPGLEPAESGQLMYRPLGHDASATTSICGLIAWQFQLLLLLLLTSTAPKGISGSSERTQWSLISSA